jgi:hypothetical protein
MSILDESVWAWRNTPFPPGSSNDALDEVHADLALYDTWVAESVLPFMDSGVCAPAVPDVLGALDEVTRRIRELDSATADPDAVLAYAAFLREARSR